MNWLNKLFGVKEKAQETTSHSSNGNGLAAQKSKKTGDPFAGLEGIRFGRYSDNNKSREKTQAWYVAEDRFKEKNYAASFTAFFDYLRDEQEDNVVFRQDGVNISFTLIQGSKKIHGSSDGATINAHSALAVMESPSTAVMRRLLEMNYSLYYSHSGMEGDTLQMVFISDVSSTNPSKLYYGLRELATKADRQDDLLLTDFSALKPTDHEHLSELPQQELDIKYKYFRKWIEETLKRVSELNQDSFSGAVAYLLLSLIYRIDFLLTPEAKLLAELEKINGMYWDKKEEIALVERNQMMKEGVRKLLDITRENFAKSMYRSKSTFSIATPPKADKVKDHVISANKDSHWYIDNKYPDLAEIINEYGLLYNQFIYSMPRVQTDLLLIYMVIAHQDFFTELGMKEQFYDRNSNVFNEELIKKTIDAALAKFKDKFRSMKWDHTRISYKNLYEFGIDFSEQLAGLNLETKRD